MKHDRNVIRGFLLTALLGACANAPTIPAVGAGLLEPCRLRTANVDALCGAYQVWEDRAAREGRRLTLDIVVLPATGERRDDPIFVLAGGPGQPATLIALGFTDSDLRQDRDLVFVDQRGTNGDHELHCDPSDDPQDYLGPAMSDTEKYLRCRDKLAARADLRLYSTPIAMDDLDEVRAALGYERINLSGGSYGTRAALVYMRRHPETVRTAILNGVAPLAFTNPLFHAIEAQNALDLLFDDCDDDERCAAAFPDFRGDLETVFARLAQTPAEVEVEHPENGHELRVRLTRDGFAEALRFMLYSERRNRRVPLLIHRAANGDLAPFAELGLRSNWGLHHVLRHGMLLSVTCAEDVARITPEDVVRETADTFLGDIRVRDQRAICEEWPKSELPPDYAEPVTADVPALLLSGRLDPVTSPRWGEEGARNLPRSLHLVFPGAHGVRGPCVRGIVADFLASGSIGGLDTSCVQDVRPAPFDVEL